MIFREFPDVAPRPLTAANAAFRAAFYKRWGRENAVVSGTAARAEFAPFRQALSIKAASGGAEEYLVGTRRVRVDDDTLLVLNEGRVYGSTLAGPRPVTSFSVFFRPGLAAELHAAWRASTEQLLDQAATLAAQPLEFSEHLRPHDAVLSPVLRRLQQLVAQGLDDPHLLEQECQQLVQALLAVQLQRPARADALPALRPATRVELLRRIDRATDWLQASYAQPFDLDRLAAVAHLSKYHLVRTFRAVHGVPPYTWLQRKRAAVAHRLLAATDLPAERIAEAVGFGSRVTMFRQLREHFGQGARALRRAR